MKKLLCLITALLLFAAALTASAGGLPPSADTLLVVEMPSMSAVVMREADQISESKDGSTAYIYRNIDHETFVAFSERLSEMGCELGAYTVKDNVLNTVVTKGAGTMRIVYDNSSLTCMIAYAPGACPEETVLIQGYAVGDIVVFGAYDQDQVESNGKEPIEWIVLDKNENDEYLIISKYVIDSWSAPDGFTWEDSSLRYWLNGAFYNSAFTEDEKARILTTHLDPESFPGYDADPGSATDDKVFLLSATEAEKYFKQGSDKVCYPFGDPDNPGNWRVRTMDCCIDVDGTAIHTAGEKKYNSVLDTYVYIYFQAGVRPAVRIR